LAGSGEKKTVVPVCAAAGLKAKKKLPKTISINMKCVQSFFFIAAPAFLMFILSVFRAFAGWTYAQPANFYIRFT
jgi:hypothetical protein